MLMFSSVTISLGLGNLTTALGSQLSKMGCPIPKDIPTVWATAPVYIGDVEDLMRQAVDAARARFRKDPEMILVVLPADGSGTMRLLLFRGTCLGETSMLG